jgi:hypothetical protein
MPGTPTPRLLLPLPIGADSPAELRTAITTLSETLDPAAIFLSGTLAARAALTPPPGTFYYATDTSTFAGWNGSVWVAYSPELTPTTATVSRPAVYWEVISASPSVTITLPAPVAGMMIGVSPNSSVTGTSQVTVNYGSAVLNGPGMHGVASFKLGTPDVCVVLLADGANWRIVSGQQDTGWVPLTLITGVTGNTGSYTPAARLRGDEVSIRGSLANNTGATIAASTPWAHLSGVPGPSDVNGLGFLTLVGTTLVAGGIAVSTGAISFNLPIGSSGIVPLDPAPPYSI